MPTTSLSTTQGKGATIIDGVMSDRATDRHARVVLRQATALGRFDPQRALALGVIDATELDDVRPAGPSGGSPLATSREVATS